MAERALVTKSGAVLLGDNVACDAHDRIKTSAGCNPCTCRPPLRFAQQLEALREGFDDKSHPRPYTKPSMNRLNSKMLAAVKTLEYGKVLKYGDEKISLHQSRPHFGCMPGFG